MSSAERMIDPEGIAGYTGSPLVLFVGISTQGSGVHTTYPDWAGLFAPDSVLRGVDLPADAPADAYRRLLGAMADNDRVIGAVVTSHKLRLYRAGADLFTEQDPLVALTHEVNTCRTVDGVHAFARDPQSLDLVVPATVGERPLLCLGSGGSATALLLATQLDVPATLALGTPVPRPDAAPLTVVGRNETSLKELAEVMARCGLPAERVALRHAGTPEAWHAVLREAPPDSAVMNATGLGKTGPGSPLADPSWFPDAALAWDFNYRGPLTFLAQAAERGLPQVDGWDYFVAGWSAALAAMNGHPLTDELFDEARAAAATHVPAP